ncbi:tautomerase family protein [Rathayibacter tanaceti]|uniref:4-oxalocrotonate tautomerase n=2 Tax=Rathayibacter tanaceti TaxID=1671680 RepID=A0A166I5P5_9MICO|nr:tautomerase family protein [Rathayibacter tanaceti]KZX21672.1 4-oxalocrotonate tautomerase [Rathayibacter tanaceti]QHC54812.1 tautomerase family protein [Rathayibacter tanaceti]TCO37365.1 phenylpyruvate tautomerase PptA (4-oxalocrotonate tautomerase family) [Rathayibacter tanaceti]
MPLVRIDITRGRTPAEVRALADAVHEAIVETYGIPPRDRFQIVTQHDPGEIIAEDAGLGFDRTDDEVVIVHVFTQRGRDDSIKQRLYSRIAERLGGVGIAGSDVFIGYVENGPQDWSFGFGRAQYLTGELAVPQSAS